MTQPPENSSHQQQLVGLAALLQIGKQVRHVNNVAEFSFVVVNETRRLVRYDQALLWRRRGGSAKIIAVSGVDRPNDKSPYLIWMRKVCKYLSSRESFNSTCLVAEEHLPERLQQGWQQWIGEKALWCPLQAGDGVILGGLLLTRAEGAWQDVEVALLAQMADAYGHAWQSVQLRSLWRRPRQGRVLRMIFGVAVAALAVWAMFLPVRLTVLAPAQIVPIEPLVVSAPLQGVIKQFYVEPNQEVKAGQKLFRFDDTELRNRLQVAKKALIEVETEMQRARQQSLSVRDKTVDVDMLKARVALKQAEVKYAADTLARVEVQAERDGIVLFADANDWLGKPLVTGEKIMLVADPDRRELEIRVPVDNAINMEPGGEVRLFLNVDPSLDVRGVIRQASYEAKAMPDGTVAFQVKATLNSDLPQLRVGHMGTAKIYGQEAFVYYFLFRRPWATVRRTLGL
ncbi:MAG: HlyD family efflux transporter periplasmic adaptor subunit [Desulfobulbaceae bacterium]|nr:HlyD family efflux transporter periplasmic adaptor subunit [Desulfobulbaceae bacterium]